MLNIVVFALNKLTLNKLNHHCYDHKGLNIIHYKARRTHLCEAGRKSLANECSIRGLCVGGCGMVIAVDYPVL